MIFLSTIHWNSYSSNSGNGTSLIQSDRIIELLFHFIPNKTSPPESKMLCRFWDFKFLAWNWRGILLSGGVGKNLMSNHSVNGMSLSPILNSMKVNFSETDIYDHLFRWKTSTVLVAACHQSLNLFCLKYLSFLRSYLSHSDYT